MPTCGRKSLPIAKVEIVVVSFSSVGSVRKPALYVSSRQKLTSLPVSLKFQRGDSLRKQRVKLEDSNAVFFHKMYQ